MLLKIITWAVIAGLVGIAIVTGATNLANAREVTGECVATLAQVERDVVATHGNVSVMLLDNKEIVGAIVKAFPEKSGVMFSVMPEMVTVFGPIPTDGVTVALLVFHNDNCVVELGYAKAADLLEVVAGGGPDDLNV